MPVYPLYYISGGSYIAIPNKGWNTDTNQVVDITTTPPPATTLRSFDLPLGRVTGVKGFGFRYGDMIIRGNGSFNFKSDHAVMSGSAPRLYVYDDKRLKKWKNVEVIVEYMRVSENNPPSYAGIGIGVRSIHETQTSSVLNVPTYYAKHAFDGRFFFEKELVHQGSYVKRPSQNKSMVKGAWYRLTFKVIGQKLEGWLEKIGETTKLYQTYTDADKAWNGDPIPEGTSCFIRNDAVTDFRVRKFSIREVAI